MSTSNPDEELFSSIASLSPPLSLKSGTLYLPNVSNSFPLDINPTPEPTQNVIPSTTQTTSQHLSSTLKTRLSATPPPPNNLYITIDNHPVPPKKKYNILEDPVFSDSGVLAPLFIR